MRAAAACMAVLVIVALGQGAQARLLRGHPVDVLKAKSMRRLSQVGNTGWLDPTWGYYGSASAAYSFGSGNYNPLMDSLRGSGYGVAMDAGYSGVSLKSLQDRGDRLVTRYRSGDPFDM